MKTLKKIHEKAVEHYERMETWVKSQNLDDKPDKDLMLKAIGEEWHDNDCSYCEEFLINAGKSCSECPLNSQKTQRAPSYCCNGFWIKMTESTTWRQWLINEEKVKNYIINNGGKEWSPVT
jgi:hypothetical protein